MPEKCLEKNSKSLFLSSRFMTFRLLSLALSFLPSSDQFFQSDMVPPAEIMIGLLTPLWVGSFGLMSVRFAKYCFLGHTFSCHTPTRAGWIVLWLTFCFLIDPVMGFVEYLETKSSELVKAAFQKFINEYRVQLDACRRAGHNVTWHTDNGGEFVSHDLDEFCDEFAVKRSFSVPYSPQLNSHAERMWGILLRTVRVTIAESAGSIKGIWNVDVA